MKRPILLLALAATLCATQNLFAWGRLGHATVARIAEEHLTKKARANLDKWLDGESIVYYASWLDDYKPQMLVDLGYDPAKGDRMHQLPHTFSVDAEGEVVPGNRWPGTDKYLANCLYYIEESADMLKNRIRELDDSTRLARIQLIVHCVGDMHCPAHIRYPGNTTIGYYKVDYFATTPFGIRRSSSVPIRGVSPIWRGCSTGIRRRNRPRSPRVRSTTGGANRPRRRSASTTCSRASP